MQRCHRRGGRGEGHQLPLRQARRSGGAQARAHSQRHREYPEFRTAGIPEVDRIASTPKTRRPETSSDEIGKEGSRTERSPDRSCIPRPLRAHSAGFPHRWLPHHGRPRHWQVRRRSRPLRSPPRDRRRRGRRLQLVPDRSPAHGPRGAGGVQGRPRPRRG